MAKNVNAGQGQKSQAFVPKNTPNYSRADMEALTKLGPDPTRAGPFGTNVPTCDLCGSPIAGSDKSDPDAFLQEMSVGRHFKCHSAAALAAQKNAPAAPKWADEQLSEEERAAAFNSDDTVDPRDPRIIGNVGGTVQTPAGPMPFQPLPETGLAKQSMNIKEDLAKIEQARLDREAEIKAAFAKGDPGKVGE